jgi:hypothetical protein
MFVIGEKKEHGIQQVRNILENDGIGYFMHCVDPTNTKRPSKGVLSVHALFEDWDEILSRKSQIFGDDIF